MHEAVARALESHAPHIRVETQLFFKNAASPEFFMHCTQTFVPADTDIILMEVATNMWPSIERVTRAVAKVRRHAPFALPLFVNWLQSHKWNGPAAEIKLTAVAKAQAFEMITVAPSQKTWWGPEPRALTREAGSDTPRKLKLLQPLRFFSDLVHPSITGHALLGAVVAERIISQLNLSSAAAGPSFVGEGREVAPTLPGAKPGELADDGEICYTRADALPVERTPGSAPWMLVDEGKAKGVPKLGLVSNRVGETLSLRVPVVPSSNASCSAGIVITLGYLVSSHPSMGSLHVSCEACACQGLNGRRSGIGTQFPFPLMATSTWQLDAEAKNGFKLGNASVTATTSFLAAALSRDKACIVQVTHQHSSSTGGSSRCRGREEECRDRQRTPSRVRIDSMNARPAQPIDERKVHTFAAQSEEGRRYLQARGPCALSAKKEWAETERLEKEAWWRARHLVVVPTMIVV
jgi:hypothetical protein